MSDARPANGQKPVIFLVDDDADARALMTRLLERRYATDYEVLTADDAKDGLRALTEARDRGAEVALLLADQSMTAMSGVDFLGDAAELHPDAERVVVVAWNELEPAREEIVRGAATNVIDSYVIRPWRDADETFYHAISKFLEDWDRGHRPQFEAIRVIGVADDAGVRELCAALYRSGIAYGFYDATSDAGVALLAQCGPDPQLPIALTNDGRLLRSPTAAVIATALGVNVDPTGRTFDVVIVGSGPAGMAAAVYGSSEGLDVLVLEHEALGGQAASSSLIRNYLGFPRGLAGAELTERAFRQAWFFGTSFLIGRTVKSLRGEDGEQVLTLDDGSEVRTRTTVLASGVAYRRLGIPRLEALVGRGVYYGAPLTEAHGLAGKQVVVVGGGNSSAQAILYLARFAEHAILVVRDPEIWEMSEYLEREIEINPKIEVRVNTTVADALGDGRLRAIVLRDNVSGETAEVAAAACFLLIGAEPRTDWLPAEIQRDERGYLVTGNATDVALRPAGYEPAALETTMPGVFAAGDVRLGSMKRIAAAVGEGSSVIRMCHQVINRREREAATARTAG